MSEQTGGSSGAAQTEREMREHEKEARERDSDERSADDTGGGGVSGMADGIASDASDPDDAAPPGNAGRASNSGG